MTERKTGISNCFKSCYGGSKDEYPEFLDSIKTRFEEAIAGKNPLFITNFTTELFGLFLSKLPEEARQYYTCTACRHFVNDFGRLVTVSSKGGLESALWDDEETPEFFKAAVRAVKASVLKQKIQGVFLSDFGVLGRPVTEGFPRGTQWTHMSVELPTDRVNRDRLLNASQAMALKHEEFKMLISGLLEYPINAVEQAVNLLQTDALYRSEKCLGIAQWLLNLHKKRAATQNAKTRENLVWLMVATAPEGFCHIKSSMIGTLLDDIVAGLPFESVKKKFAEKMDPLQYQRPQAAASGGNIAQAEHIVEKLGIRRSLFRRYARLEELQTLWKPFPTRLSDLGEQTGVFSHLYSKPEKKSGLIPPTITITWRKFLETVIPSAQGMMFLVKTHDVFTALVTAQYADAPPIIQWDKEERRNPFSWYVYNGESLCRQWGLTPGYTQVTGICYQPSMWYENMGHQGKSVCLILKGARDMNHDKCGLALFPEILKSELHQVRATIEAYSRGEHIQGYEDSTACGIRLQGGQTWDATVQVKTAVGTAVYKLDRWD